MLSISNAKKQKQPTYVRQNHAGSWTAFTSLEFSHSLGRDCVKT
jgi:hypothetical protein